MMHAAERQVSGMPNNKNTEHRTQDAVNINNKNTENTAFSAIENEALNNITNKNAQNGAIPAIDRDDLGNLNNKNGDIAAIPAIDKAGETDETANAKSKAAAKRSARRQAKAKKRQARRARRQAKKQQAIRPLLARPMICPPDASDHSATAELWGLILRAAVIFFAIFGMSFTLLDALGFFSEAEGELNAAIPALAALVLSAAGLLCTLRSTRRAALPISIIAIGGAAAAAVIPNAIYIYRAVVNGVVTRLHGRGFLSVIRFEQPAEYGSLGQGGCVAIAACILCCIYALAYLPTLMRRARPSIPVAVTVITLVPIFVYNLTSSNWGIMMIIAAFSGALCMCVYDGIYLRRPAADKYDTETLIFEPVATEALAGEETSREVSRRAKREAKQAKRAARAERRAERRRAKRERDAGVRSADEEISEYFSAPSKKKQKKSKKARGKGERRRALTPAERREAKARRRADRKARRLRDREIMGARRRAAAAGRAVSIARASAGGFAGATACGIVLLMLFIPALTTSGSFSIIKSIDQKLDYYREYVTALLMGDDPLLDELAYEGASSGFAPRSTVATHPFYTGEQLFEVNVPSAGYPIYLRGWVATDYDRESSSWLTATTDSEAFLTYRELFGTAIDPSEAMLRGTYSYIAPTVVRDLDFASGRYGNSSTKYALISMQVNVKRLKNIGYAAYLPSFTMRTYSPIIETTGGRTATALRAWGSAAPSEVTYINFFDGIYTGYKFARDTEGYGAVAYITSMKTSSFSQNVAAAIAQFNTDRELIERDKTEKAESLAKYGSVQSSAGVFRTEETGEGRYTVYREGKLYYTVSYAEDGTVTIDLPDNTEGIVYRYIYSSEGELQKKSAERLTQAEEGAPYVAAPDLPAIINYLEFYSDEQKTALSGTWRVSDYYTRYVYDTYTAKAGSSIIADLTEEIISSAHVETVDYTDEGDEIHSILPVDLSRAAEHNEYADPKRPYTPTSLVTDAEVYTQRHRLVMEIVNWLRDNCTYTLTPTLDETEGLDGVERFLTVTHEGYCVQFASSLALMLREAGIPARYVDGYIASNFVRRGSDGYFAAVRDREAHAWVEVWYDGIGWVQYEATPAYYSAIYEYASSDRIDTTPGWIGGEDEDDPDEGGLSEEELAALLREQEEAERRRAIIRTVIVAAVVLLLIAACAVTLVIRRRRAKARQAAIRRMLATLLAPQSLDGAARTALVRQFSDELTPRLAKLGFEPRPGEFRGELAARIWQDLGEELSARARDAAAADPSAFKKQPAMTAGRMAECFDIIAAAEFGGAEVDISDEDLKKLPALWQFLELK